MPRSQPNPTFLNQNRLSQDLASLRWFVCILLSLPSFVAKSRDKFLLHVWSHLLFPLWGGGGCRTPVFVRVCPNHTESEQLVKKVFGSLQQNRNTDKYYPQTYSTLFAEILNTQKTFFMNLKEKVASRLKRSRKQKRRPKSERPGVRYSALPRDLADSDDEDVLFAKQLWYWIHLGNVILLANVCEKKTKQNNWAF